MDYLIAPVFVLGALAVAFLPLALRRRLVDGHSAPETREIATSAILRIATLHALILALVFADGQMSFRNQQQNIVLEAAKLSEVGFQLERYADPEQTTPIQRRLGALVETVRGDEWSALARREPLSREAWATFNEVSERVLLLSPQGIRQETIYQGIYDDLRQIAVYRENREFYARNTHPSMFWVVAGVGFVLITSLYGVFQPDRAAVRIVLAFAFMMGLVLYVIFEYATPYTGLIQLSAAPYDVSLANLDRLVTEATRYIP